MEQDELITPQGSQEPQTFNVKVWTDVNGESIMQSVSQDELVNGYLRQSDYTRKTQELADERKVLDQKDTQATSQGFQWDTNDDEAVDAYLIGKWYAKAEDIERLVEQKLKWVTKSQQDEQSIQFILTSNPELKQFEWLIRKLASTDDRAIEDIVVSYGLSNHDKLSKAKQRDVVGWSNKMESGKAKPVSEWTPAERATFEAQANKSQFR